MTLRNALFLLIGVLVMACGDDDRPPPAPTPDASNADAGRRDGGPMRRDSGPDTGTMDAGPPPDSGPTDGGPDTGPPDSGPMDAGPPPERREQLATGAEHTCAIRRGGLVACWGDNDFGEIGDGSRTSRNVPTQVLDFTDAYGIAAGENHSCAMAERGRIRCWGLNTEGELGDGTRMNSSVPTRVVMIDNAIDICGGRSHTCAALANGTVRCWGLDGNGQLGDGMADIGSNVPSTPAVGVTDAIEVSCGRSHTCALTSSMQVWCWGSNQYGQLGFTSPTPEEAPFNPTPVMVPLTTADAVGLSVGGEHSCVIRAGGTVWCFGRNDFGQLGVMPFDMTTMTGTASRSTPESLGIAGAFAIDLGGKHSCAVRGAGSYVCWGRNQDGELGDATMMNRFTPMTMTSLLPDVIEISAGGNNDRGHTCALDMGNTVWCWGRNSGGQLGLGMSPPMDTTIPRPVTFMAPL